MPDTKPRRMWHADGEGRCHTGCESWGSKHGLNGCDLIEVLPWEVFDQPSPNRLSPCPFAVLADVLCVHQPPHEEQVDEKASREHDFLQCDGCTFRLLGRTCVPPLNGGECLSREPR